MFILGRKCHTLHQFCVLGSKFGALGQIRSLHTEIRNHRREFRNLKIRDVGSIPLESAELAPLFELFSDLAERHVILCVCVCAC